MSRCRSRIAPWTARHAPPCRLRGRAISDSLTRLGEFSPKLSNLTGCIIPKQRTVRAAPVREELPGCHRRKVHVQTMVFTSTRDLDSFNSNRRPYWVCGSEFERHSGHGGSGDEYSRNHWHFAPVARRIGYFARRGLVCYR